jgi:hypothetical protein
MEFVDGDGAAALASMEWLLPRLWRSRNGLTGCGTLRGSRECGRGDLRGPAEEVRGGWTCSIAGALWVAMNRLFLCKIE